MRASASSAAAVAGLELDQVVNQLGGRRPPAAGLVALQLGPAADSNNRLNAPTLFPLFRAAEQGRPAGQLGHRPGPKTQAKRWRAASSADRPAGEPSRPIRPDPARSARRGPGPVRTRAGKTGRTVRPGRPDRQNPLLLSSDPT